MYDLPNTPEIDMRPRLRAWTKVYENRIGRRLQADDYLFPYIGTNGVIYPKKMETRDGIQKRMSDFARSTGIDKHFTTHSPRRGGAQYRFMFAPIGERWSLNIIRWWGGWAEGEHVCPASDKFLQSFYVLLGGHSHQVPHQLASALREWSRERLTTRAYRDRQKLQWRPHADQHCDGCRDSGDGRLNAALLQHECGRDQGSIFQGSNSAEQPNC